MAVAAAGCLAELAVPSKAAVFADSTDLGLAVQRAQPYVAINGGPAVTVEQYRADGTVSGYASGSLISSPDGLNRTVLTASHVWFNALNTGPGAYLMVLTGTINDRGLEFRVDQDNVLLAPGANGTLQSLDLAALRLDTHVPNTGVFEIGASIEGQVATTTGNGIRLTQAQGANGTFAPRDGEFGRFDGKLRAESFFPTSDYYMNAIVFNVGQYAYGGVGANGDSGSGVFSQSSVQFGLDGRISYAQYVGTAVGYVGDRLGPFSDTAYVDANNPIANDFIRAAVVPEPASTAILGLGAACLVGRRRRS